jgi:peptide/nickel transport system substrate-binding protein
VFFNGEKKVICTIFYFPDSPDLMTAGCAEKDSAQSETTAGEALAEEALVENTAEGSQNVDALNLSGGDCGYPQPFTIYPRGPGSSKVGMIFDSLLERDEKGIIPWLAESWNVSSDGTDLQFISVKVLWWSVGEPFTANDVKFTFDYEQEHVRFRWN